MGLLSKKDPCAGCHPYSCLKNGEVIKGIDSQMGELSKLHSSSFLCIFDLNNETKKVPFDVLGFFTSHIGEKRVAKPD